MIGVQLYVFPIIGIIGGALYSCYNYFYVILNGGVGKNGSTVAVRQLHTLTHFLLKSPVDEFDLCRTPVC